MKLLNDLRLPPGAYENRDGYDTARALRRRGRRQRVRNAQFRRWLEALDEEQTELEFVVEVLAELLIERDVFSKEDLASKILALGAQQAGPGNANDGSNTERGTNAH